MNTSITDPQPTVSTTAGKLRVGDTLVTDDGTRLLITSIVDGVVQFADGFGYAFDPGDPVHVLPRADERADRILSALAEFVNQHYMDSSGGHLKAALRTALLAARHDLAAHETVDLAVNDYWDERVRDASREQDRMLGLAEAARQVRENAAELAAEHDEMDQARAELGRILAAKAEVSRG